MASLNDTFVQNKCALKLRLTSDQYRIKQSQSVIIHKGRNKLAGCREEQKALEMGAGDLDSELSNTLFGCRVGGIISLGN